MVWKIKTIISMCFLSSILMLNGCVNKSEEQTLRNVIFEKNIDFNGRNTITSIHFDDYIYEFDNKYNDFSEKILESFDEYNLDSVSEFEYTDENIFISFMDVNYENMNLLVNKNDEIKIVYDISDEAYYHCDGIYENLTDEISVISEEYKKYYQVTMSSDNMLYEYLIYDKNNDIIVSDSVSDEPHITRVSEDIVCLWMQTGTGTLTRWSQYYNVKTGEKSPVYYGQTDSFENLTCNTGHGIVEVSDIFSGEILFTIKEFDEPLSDSIENIVNAFFTADGKQVHVTYIDENLQKREQFFDLTE